MEEEGIEGEEEEEEEGREEKGDGEDGRVEGSVKVEGSRAEMG